MQGGKAARESARARDSNRESTARRCLGGPGNSLLPETAGPVGPDVDFLHGPDHSGLDPLVREPGTLGGMPLVSHLSGDTRCTSGLRQLSTLMQRVRERLLAIHMLAGADGCHGRNGVHVIRRADGDGIDCAGFLFEHNPEVFVAMRLRKCLK